MPRYEYSEGASNKFWEINLSGKSFTTTYGKIGAKGQTTIKTFSSESEAKREHDKLIAEKVKKGYAPAGGAAAAGPKAPARRFEMAEGSSNKFWEISIEGTEVRTHYGKIGSAGQQTVKELDSRSEAFKEYDKLVTEKTKKGYREVGGGGGGTGGGAVGDARNPELEKAIEADPEDVNAYSVLGDWLQGQGDPRGELIALQLANKDKEARALIKKQADYLLGGLADHQKTRDGHDRPAFEWKYGYIHGTVLSYNHYAEEEFEGSLAEVLDLLLRHPSGRFLTEIAIGFNNDPNDDDLQDLIDLISRRAPATLRKLHLGDYKYAGGAPVGQGGDDTEISWYNIGNLGKLWKAVPGLRTLITQGGGLSLGKIEAPHLAHAEFRTGGLDKANAKAIATAAFPGIEHLDIWYGDDNYGGDATMKDVELLLGRTDLPKLRHLGLMNSQFADELPAALARSKLLPQLRELDLSLGCMTDAGARVLVQHKDAFHHLDRLNLAFNYIPKAAAAALKGIAKIVETGKQREDEDPEYRHPAVGE